MILFVDDEERRMENCLEELADRGFEVTIATTVESAKEVMAGSTVEMMILDVMMPPGPYENTQDGTRTGLVFLREIRDRYPTMPVILFTHVYLNAAELPTDPHTRMVQKSSVLSFELADLVEQTLNP